MMTCPDRVHIPDMHIRFLALLAAVCAIGIPGASAAADYDGYLGSLSDGSGIRRDRGEVRYENYTSWRDSLPIGSAWRVTVWSDEFQPQVTWRINYSPAVRNSIIEESKTTFEVKRNNRGQNLYVSVSCFVVRSFGNRRSPQAGERELDVGLRITSRDLRNPRTGGFTKGRYRYRVERVADPSECQPSSPTPTPPIERDDPDPPVPPVPPPTPGRCPSWNQVNPTNRPQDAYLSSWYGGSVDYWAYGSEYISFSTRGGSPTSKLSGGPGHWRRELCNPPYKVDNYNTKAPRISVQSGVRWEVHEGINAPTVSIRR